MTSRNLRSGLLPKGNAQASADTGVQIPPTQKTDKSDSDFEAYVRKGIDEIKLMFKDFEASLEFQDKRTTVLEQRVDPLEKKVRELEKKIAESRNSSTKSCRRG